MTAIPTITALPDAPTKSDPSSFDTRADSFLSALPTLAEEINAAIGVINVIDPDEAATAAGMKSWGWNKAGITPVSIYPTFQLKPDADELPAVMTFSRTCTATYFDAAGVMKTATANTPRFDYDPATSERLGLHIEEQRTNLVLHSQGYDNAVWVKTRGAVTAAATLAPDGTTTGMKLYVDDIAEIDPRIVQSSIAATIGQSYAVSVFAKAGEYSILSIIASGLNVRFDLSAGAVSQQSAGTATIEDVGGGWYRCIGIGTATATTNSLYFDIITGGVVLNSGLYLWGAQIEAGAFATSYIPTTTAQVTRLADVCTVGVSTFPFNKGQGTLYIDSRVPLSSEIVNPMFLQVDDGTGQNRIMLFCLASSSQIIARMYSGNVITANIIPATINVGDRIKAAIAYKENSFVACVNGGVVQSDNDCALPISPTTLRVGSSVGTSYLNTAVRHCTYFPRALSTAELQVLTS